MFRKLILLSCFIISTYAINTTNISTATPTAGDLSDDLFAILFGPDNWLLDSLNSNYSNEKLNHEMMEDMKKAGVDLFQWRIDFGKPEYHAAVQHWSCSTWSKTLIDTFTYSAQPVSFANVINFAESLGITVNLNAHISDNPYSDCSPFPDTVCTSSYGNNEKTLQNILKGLYL